jgi:hypothetical protein
MEISEVALIRCFKNPYNVVIKLEALMNMSPFLTVSQTCDRALPWVIQQLHEAGLRSVQTFDLHTARAALHDCDCPHHGTDQCDCQMVVLLVYGKTEEPATLILHGNDGTTWLSITASAKSNRDLDEQIQRALGISATTTATANV